MTQELWYAIGGFALTLVAVGGVIISLARTYIQGVEARLVASDKMQSVVVVQARELTDLGRRLDEFSTRLTRLDGELAADLRRLEDGVGALRESLAGLRGELRITEKLRGMLGKRAEDMEKS